MASIPTYKNYIGGHWVVSRSGETFENRNPADERELIGLFQRSNAADVDDAVEAAARAFPEWSHRPAPKRAELLYRLGEILRRLKDPFARDMTREMGKVLKETGGDVQEAIDTAYYAAGEGRRLFGQTVPAELPDKFAMSVRSPVGVAALVTPWNFPMAIPSWKLLPALLCGNTVVLKPATDTPLSSVNFVKACEEAGVPAGVVNLVTGSGSAVGTPLIEHAQVRVVSFTGSTEVGRDVNRSCAQTFKRVSLEMGGKNVQIVLADADLDLALEGALWGSFGTTGQRCTATSRLVLERGIARAFTERFVARARALRVGPGLDPSSEMGPLVNRAQRERVLDYVEVGKKEGAKLLSGGNTLDGGELRHGAFMEPTVFGDVTPSMRLAREEIFGPVASLISVADLDEALAVANDTAYGLSASIYTRDVNKAFHAMRELDTGIVYVNAPTIGAEVQLPFGGTKQTGNGHREAGSQVLDLYTEWKSVYVDFSGRLQRAQIDTEAES